MWKKNKNLNKNSIGIELVNKGHKFGYQKFTKIQIKNLILLCKKLKKKYKIKNQFYSWPLRYCASKKNRSR